MTMICENRMQNKQLKFYNTKMHKVVQNYINEKSSANSKKRCKIKC